MLVSTKALSLMKAIARWGASPAKRESLAKPGQCAALGRVIRLVAPDQLLQAIRQQPAHRRSFLGREDPRLTQELRIHAEPYVRPCHQDERGTVLRAKDLPWNMRIRTELGCERHRRPDEDGHGEGLVVRTPTRARATHQRAARVLQEVDGQQQRGHVVLEVVLDQWRQAE